MAKHKGPSPKELYWARKEAQERERAAYLPPGLINHGNTCFMNSVLQGLAATRLLADLVLFNDIPNPVQKHSTTPLLPRRSPQLTNGHGRAGVYEQPAVEMPIGDKFIDVVSKAWTIQSERARQSLSPKDLLAAVGRKYDQYLDFAQQDAHEFLRILLDAMRMEEMDVIKQRQPMPPKQPKKRRSSAPPSPSIPEEDRLIPLPDMIFGGKLTSILVCQKCKHVSQTYEDFNDISLSIKPEDYIRGRKRDKLKNFAKKLAAFPGSSLSTGIQIQRSSSVPPSPKERKDSQMEEKPPPHVVKRKQSMEDLQSDRPTTESDSGQEGAATAESDGPNVIVTVHEVPAADTKHVEFLQGDKSGKSDKEKKRKSAQDGWSKFGRRISMTVGFGKGKEKRGRSKERADNLHLKDDVMVTSSDQELPLPIPPSLHDSSRTMSASSMPETKHSQQPIIHAPIPERSTSQPSGFLPTIQRSKSPKPPAPTEQETAYLRKILADVITGSSSSNSPLAILKHTSQHLHLPSVNGKSQGETPGGATRSVWLGLSQYSGLEECLRLFTAVEVLEGENMVGCRRCWKIANGMYENKGDREEDGDSEEENGAAEVEVTSDIPQYAQPSYSDSSNSSLSSPSSDARTSPAPSGLTSYRLSASLSTPTITTFNQIPQPIHPSSASLPIDNPLPSFNQCNDLAMPRTSDNMELLSLQTFQTPGRLPIPSISTTTPEAVSGQPKINIQDYSLSEDGNSSTTDLSQYVSAMESPLPSTPNQPPSIPDLDPASPSPAPSSSVQPYSAIPVITSNGGPSTSKESLLIPPRFPRRKSNEPSSPGELTGTEDSEDTGAESSSESLIEVSSNASSSPDIGPGQSILASTLSPLPPKDPGSDSIAQPTLPPSRPKRQKKEVILRPAFKRYLIETPPPVLVIHFKRFQQTQPSFGFGFGNTTSFAGRSLQPFLPSSSFSSAGGFKKLEEFVSFPEYLDLTPFLAPRKEDFGVQKKGKENNDKGKEQDHSRREEKPVEPGPMDNDSNNATAGGEGKQEDEEKCMYRLYAVVVHIGNMLGGHYVAYTALPNEPPLASYGTPETFRKGNDEVQQTGGNKDCESVEPPQALSSSISMSSTTTKHSVSTNGTPGDAGTSDAVGPISGEITPSPVQSKASLSGGNENANQKRQWAYISDTTVRLVSLEEVLNARAYICMYERI